MAGMSHGRNVPWQEHPVAAASLAALCLCLWGHTHEVTLLLSATLGHSQRFYCLLWKSRVWVKVA